MEPRNYLIIGGTSGIGAVLSETLDLRQIKKSA